MIILENDIMLPSIMEESENDEHADNNKMQLIQFYITQKRKINTPIYHNRKYDRKMRRYDTQK